VAETLVPQDFRQRFHQLTSRQLSRGHAERFDAIVWGNDLAFGSWEGSGPLPEGSLLVEEAISRDVAGDKAMGLLLMQKQLGTWRFTAIGPEGDVADESRTERCATCHEEAPGDGVFQVRR
jgi:hypothetical protein